MPSRLQRVMGGALLLVASTCAGCVSAGEQACARVRDLHFSQAVTTNCRATMDSVAAKSPAAHTCMADCIRNAVNATAAQSCPSACPEFESDLLFYTPEEVCGQLAEKPPQLAFQTDRRTCELNWVELQRVNRPGYRCASACVVRATDRTAMGRCTNACEVPTMLLGQSPDPEIVCRHMVVLDGENGSMATVPVCMGMLGAARIKDPEAYACMSTCLMNAHSSHDATICDDQCPAFKRALGM